MNIYIFKLQLLARKHEGELDFHYNRYPWTRKNGWEVIFKHRVGGWIEIKSSTFTVAVRKLLLRVEEYYAIHWRDDDTPEFECGYGICGKQFAHSMTPPVYCFIL